MSYSEQEFELICPYCGTKDKYKAEMFIVPTDEVTTVNGGDFIFMCGACQCEFVFDVRYQFLVEKIIRRIDPPALKLINDKVYYKDSETDIVERVPDK
jgi:hypothetical protein